MILTDVLANPGNSGGPFINAQGRLVGMLTLGMQSDARTNDTALVPGYLIQEMIKAAFQRGKIGTDVDMRPFYELFVNRDRLWEIPGFERMAGQDCVVLKRSGRICGAAADPVCTWRSPLGNIEVPTSAMAYVVADDDGATAFIDGGDRFRIEGGGTFRFVPPGGEAVAVDLADLKSISFRQPENKPAPPQGPASVISGNNYRLSLTDLSGEVAFKTELGVTLKVPAANIMGIGEENGDRMLQTEGGSRMTGEFADHRIQAKLAWAGTPVTFTFGRIENVDIAKINFAERGRSGELSLAESMKDSDPRLRRIAELIDANDLAAAEPMIVELNGSSALRDFSKERKEQLQALQGELELRKGRFSEAEQIFKKLRRPKNENVCWMARSRLAMLEQYPDGHFESGSISEPAVFKQCGRRLAGEYERKGAVTVEELEGTTADSRGDYTKAVKRAEQAEEQILIANRLTGGTTEELVIRLWRALARLHGSEIGRLNAEKQKVQEERRDDRGRTEFAQRQATEAVARIDRFIEEAQSNVQQVEQKIGAAGFIIDDPDRDVVDKR